jgi:hypothetical protein
LPSFFREAKPGGIPETSSVSNWDVEGTEGLFRYTLEIKQSPDKMQPATIRSETVTCNGDTLYRFADGEVHLHGDRGRPNADFPFQSNQSFLANLDTRAYRLGWFKAFVEGIRILQPNPFGMEKTTRQEFPLLERWCRDHRHFGATRRGWSEGSESCDEFMKFGMSSSGCESRPAKG